MRPFKLSANIKGEPTTIYCDDRKKKSFLWICGFSHCFLFNKTRDYIHMNRERNVKVWQIWYKAIFRSGNSATTIYQCLFRSYLCSIQNWIGCQSKLLAINQKIILMNFVDDSLFFTFITYGRYWQSLKVSVLCAYSIACIYIYIFNFKTRANVRNRKCYRNGPVEWMASASVNRIRLLLST